MKSVILSALLCVSFSATAALAYDPVGDRAAEELAKYNQTGEFEKCISYKDIKRTKVLGDDKILFEMKRNKFLLNTMSTSCTRLGVDRQFVFQHGNAKICARDIVSTARGGCNLSEFEILDEKS
ncbi:MAG: hypothetical protein HOJ34_04190 [Kordiimonadaceae bacterium]|jgi:hypothetical protein|nr:hypothetical protein [Kordiimonadaceae bacterium]MBT6034860.1 hypothetical protein [Kordiimonadaceae bacterium]MBT6328962.1 hypothetical protein [Kordiimonadaceae bacterium]MBT7581442.1 hypothetical protein [Kordiimonadaceae bacterium]